MLLFTVFFIIGITFCDNQITIAFTYWLSIPISLLMFISYQSFIYFMHTTGMPDASIIDVCCSLHLLHPAERTTY